MDMRKVLQVADRYNEYDDANEALEFQRTQVGIIAGRIVDRRTLGEGWLMQSFHDAGDMPLGVVGDCARVVLAPESMLVDKAPNSLEQSLQLAGITTTRR